MLKHKIKLENARIVEIEYDDFQYALVKLKNQPYNLGNIFLVDESFYLEQTRKETYDLIVLSNIKDKPFQAYFFADGGKERNVRAEEIELIHYVKIID